MTFEVISETYEIGIGGVMVKRAHEQKASGSFSGRSKITQTRPQPKGAPIYCSAKK